MMRRKALAAGADNGKTRRLVRTLAAAAAAVVRGVHIMDVAPSPPVLRLSSRSVPQETYLFHSRHDMHLVFLLNPPASSSDPRKFSRCYAGSQPLSRQISGGRSSVVSATEPNTRDTQYKRRLRLLFVSEKS